MSKKNKKSYDELAKEWSEKNKGNFSDYTKGSHYPAIWICSRGHEWPALVKTRYSGYNCPYCSGRRVIKGENDLQTKYPELAKEWHPTKNNLLIPSNVKYGAKKKVWWMCSRCKHEWPAYVCNRTSGKGCPACNHKAILPKAKIEANVKVGITVGMSLADLYPQIAEEWDRDNNLLTPEQVLPNSNEFVNWKCRHDHTWPAKVNSRTRPGRPNKCPYCSGKRAIPGETDVATTHPDIIKEWDFEKNKKLPSEYLKSSHKRVFWKCEKNHSYKAAIVDRVRGVGCKECKKERNFVDAQDG